MEHITFCKSIGLPSAALDVIRCVSVDEAEFFTLKNLFFQDISAFQRQVMAHRNWKQRFLFLYGDNPITMIGSDPGVCAAFNGGTHMPFEDMALYRAIPGATVMDVTDAAMLEDVLKQSVNRPGVKYIRVGRKNNARMYAEGSRFEIGRAIELRAGTDVTLIACGVMVHEAMQAANALAQMGIDAGVVDMFTVKPLDEETVERCARETGAIVTCENHNRIGGLTDAVAQTLALRCPVPLEHVAVEDEFGEVGPQDYLQKRFGLTADHIIHKARKVLSRKR